jgi:hypothetical protein
MQGLLHQFGLQSELLQLQKELGEQKPPQQVARSKNLEKTRGLSVSAMIRNFQRQEQIREQKRREMELQGQAERFWEGLYADYGSPELRREFLCPFGWMGNSPMHRLSAEQKIELLIQDMQETLAFSGADERARLHADWEWDLEAPSGDAFVLENGQSYHRGPCMWNEGWSWEQQSRRRRARALNRLDSEFDRLAEQSTELYLADGEALADFEAAAAGDVGVG